MNDVTISPEAMDLAGDLLSRGSYYAEGAWVRTDPARGVARSRQGTRMVSLTSDFLLGFRKAIEDECGPAAPLVFKSAGRKWGLLFAKRFEKEMSEFYGKPLREFPLAVFQACFVEMASHHGWGRLSLDLSLHGKGLILVRLDHAVMAELVDTSDAPVDGLLAGILAGIFAHLSGEDLDCVQTACAARGDATSRFVVGLRERLAPVDEWIAQGATHDDVVARLAAAAT
jgi:predicted hydrocarbon binding protein